MARGNQRDKAREKNLKAAAGQVWWSFELQRRSIDTDNCPSEIKDQRKLMIVADRIVCHQF